MHIRYEILSLGIERIINVIIYNIPMIYLLLLQKNNNILKYEIELNKIYIIN